MAALMVKASAWDTVSVPVVTVMVRSPVAAAAAIVRLAVKLVLLATVIVPTVIPAPKLTWLWPCTKLVLTPVIVTVRFCCPC